MAATEAHRLEGGRATVRRAVGRVRREYRQATSGARLLPDYIVIGAQRAGSTSLWRYLARHPAVAPPVHKELHFFDQNFHRGLPWYRRHFPLAVRRTLAERRGGVLVTGEASPYYLFHPLAAGRIRETLPGVRLVCLLRDPVERAYSHYQLARRYGHEDLPFADAVAAEAERLAGEEERIAADPAYKGFHHRWHSYVARGFYADQLARYTDAFGRDRLLLLRSEDMFADPAAAYREVLAFLGLPAHDLGEYRAFNQRPYEGMPAATRAELEELYREPNRRLEALAGRPLRWSS